MDIIKRERSAKFSLHERNILAFLVKKYQTILEKKKSDASSSKMKEAAWENIKNKFNARSRGTFRSTKTLKIKYKGLKRAVRKKSAATLSEINHTGGGKITLDEGEEQIKDMIRLSTNGIESICDSDILPQPKENQANLPKKSLLDELTQAKLELVQLKKKFLEEEMMVKKKVWKFEENECNKEAEFKEKERRWKEKEYQLNLRNNF